MSKTDEGSLIVKVQTAQNDPNLPALVYDQGRVFYQHVPAAAVAPRMKGRPKAFFFAKVSFGQLVLGKEAPNQPW